MVNLKTYLQFLLYVPIEKILFYVADDNHEQKIPTMSIIMLYDSVFCTFIVVLLFTD